MKMFTYFLISFLILTSSAEPDLEEQHQQETQEENINPVNDHIGEYQTIKDQDKRTIFGPKHHGWAKHVAISPSGAKYVVGYTPVDLKYIPVVKPLHLRVRPQHHHHHHHHQLIRPAPRPIVSKPLIPVRPIIHQDGWKPSVPIVNPIHVPPPQFIAKPIVPVHQVVNPIHVKPIVPSRPLIPITVAHPVPIAPVAHPVPIAPIAHPLPVAPIAHPVPVAPALPIVPNFPLSVLQQLPGAKFHTPGPGASVEYHGTYNFVPHVHAHPHVHLDPHGHAHSHLHLEPHAHPHLHLDQHAHAHPHLHLDQHAHAHPHLHLDEHAHAHPHLHLDQHAHAHPHLHLEPHAHPHLHLDQHAPHLHLEPQAHPHLHLEPQAHPHLHVEPHLHPHLHLDPHLHPHAHLQPHLHQFQPQPLVPSVHSHPHLVHDDGRHLHQVPVEEPQFLPQQPTLLRPHPAHQVPINPNANGQALFQHDLPGNVHHAFSQQVNTDHSNVLIRQSLDIPNIHPGHTDLQIPVHLPQHPNYLPEGRHFQPFEPQQPGVIRPGITLEPPFTHK